jgi:hypothetical protein
MLARFLKWIVLLACLSPAMKADTLNSRVVEGDGATNNVRTRMARAPVVELKDEEDHSIASSPVTFQTPVTLVSGPTSFGPH